MATAPLSDLRPAEKEPVRSKVSTASSLERLVEALEAAGCDPRDGRAKCPAHDDHNPSLSYMTADDGKVMLHCFAGCLTPDILPILDIDWSDLFPDTVYDYTDENGDLLYQVVRRPPKDIKQRRPDPERPGEWIWSIKDVCKVLYRLPDVLRVKILDGLIYVVEGEKNADDLNDYITGKGYSETIIATTFSGGAEHWTKQAAEALRGANVQIIADKDPPGNRHARGISSYLGGVPIFSGAEGCHDISDHLAAGKRLEELIPHNIQAGASSPMAEPSGWDPVDVAH